MPQPLAETIAVVALVAAMGVAILGAREAAIAVPLAALLTTTNIVPAQDAWDEVARLGPTVGFLAAILLLARLCADEGVFAAAGRWMSTHARGDGPRLLIFVFGFGAAITALLSLDATAVLLTPAVYATARQAGVSAKPHLYACVHLANSASLILPVSNLTNLLAFEASGLSFHRFAALMALPWLAVLLIEYVVIRRYFAADLGTPTMPDPLGGDGVPVFAITVVAATLGGFGITSAVGVEPVWSASAGAIVLGARRLLRRQTTSLMVIREAKPEFCLFVLALGVIVVGVTSNGLDSLVRRMIPDNASLPALLLTAAIAALLANAVNNLPATLALVPVAALAGPGVVLAVLIGVNVGPNLTYVGSLATLLWRRASPEHELGDFTRLGLLTAPLAITAATAALWLALQI